MKRVSIGVSRLHVLSKKKMECLGQSLEKAFLEAYTKQYKYSRFLTNLSQNSNKPEPVMVESASWIHFLISNAQFAPEDRDNRNSRGLSHLPLLI